MQGRAFDARSLRRVASRLLPRSGVLDGSQRLVRMYRLSGDGPQGNTNDRGGQNRRDCEPSPVVGRRRGSVRLAKCRGDVCRAAAQDCLPDSGGAGVGFDDGQDRLPELISDRRLPAILFGRSSRNRQNGFVGLPDCFIGL